MGRINQKLNNWNKNNLVFSFPYKYKEWRQTRRSRECLRFRGRKKRMICWKVLTRRLQLFLQGEGRSRNCLRNNLTLWTGQLFAAKQSTVKTKVNFHVTQHSITGGDTLNL